MTITKPVLRRGLASVVAFGAAFVLAACTTAGGGGGEATSSAQPTPDGDISNCEVWALIVTNVTGAGAQNGTSSKAGGEAAAEYINDNGGVLGCTLKLDIRDNASDYTKSLPIVQEALAQKEYLTVVAADFGAASVVPYVARLGQFSSFVNGTKGLTDPKLYPYLFDTVIPSADSAKIVGNYAVTTDKVKNVAILGDTTTVGQAVMGAFKASVEAAGGTVVAEESIELSAVNMTPAIQRLQASGADALMFNLFGAAAGYFVRDLAASGWTPTVYGGGSFAAFNIESVVPAEDVRALDILVAGPAVNSAPPVNEGLTSLIEQLKASGNELSSAMSLFAQTHDALIYSVAAANATGTNDAAAMSSWLEENGSTDIPGMAFSTQTGFSAASHEWHPKDGIAMFYSGEFKDGQFQTKRLGLFNA